MPDTFILANDAASVYLLNREQHRFFEISEANNRMRIRRGEVGRACVVYRMSWVTQGKGREQFLRLVAAWKEKGFVEAEPEAEITEACEATELFAADIENHPVFSRFFSLAWSAELRGTQKRIMLFRNSFSYDGDFDVEEMADTGLINGLIIQGDVSADTERRVGKFGNLFSSSAKGECGWLGKTGGNACRPLAMSRR